MTDTYDAVVFDCDGVLVEPTDTAVLVDAVVDAFDAFGVDIDRSVARRSVTEDEVPTETAREHGIDPEAFWHYRELTASLAQQTHVRAGGKPVYDDVAALADLSCPIAGEQQPARDHRVPAGVPRPAGVRDGAWTATHAVGCRGAQARTGVRRGRGG
ncbi:hypothetical protein [Halapricum sp. CBA1109]|uniref:hypothetical protein n=1 Tax=Halapricum sp. CBA1109 TaxID=2668068 RepID=UPI001E5109E0|nr:hypothetical protein [Halapricum sp. CBA1109]